MKNNKLNPNPDINEFMLKGYSLADSIKLVQQAKNVYKCGEQYGLTFAEAKYMVGRWVKGGCADGQLKSF